MEDGREVTQGNKHKNAIAKKVPILTEDEFEEWIQRRTGLREFQFCIRDQILQEINTKPTQSQKSIVNT